MNRYITIQDTADMLTQDFIKLKSWEHRFLLLMSIASNAPIIDTSSYTKTFKVEGCASRVELLFNPQSRLIEGRADSLIIKGLIEFFLKPIYSNRNVLEVESYNSQWIEQTNIANQLTLGRGVRIELIEKSVREILINY